LDAEDGVAVVGVVVEPPAALVVQRAGDAHRQDGLEPEQPPDDHAAVRPRAGARDDQPVPARLDRPRRRTVGGDALGERDRLAFEGVGSGLGGGHGLRTQTAADGFAGRSVVVPVTVVLLDDARAALPVVAVLALAGAGGEQQGRAREGRRDRPAQSRSCHRATVPRRAGSGSVAAAPGPNTQLRITRNRPAPPRTLATASAACSTGVGASTPSPSASSTAEP